MELSRRQALFAAGVTAVSGLTPEPGAAATVVNTADAEAVLQGTPVRRAARSLAQDYLRAYEGNGERAMQYLLADLMHYADNYRLGFDKTLDAAKRNYLMDIEVEAGRAGQSLPSERRIAVERPFSERHDPFVLNAFKAFLDLGPFIPEVQLNRFYHLAREGHQREIFEKLIGWANLLEKMPRINQQRGKYENATACLHYAAGDEHWYILERDENKKLQWEVYGINDVGDGKPWQGLFRLPFVLYKGADFDFDFSPRPLTEIIPGFADFLGRDAPPRTWPSERSERASSWVANGIGLNPRSRAQS